MRSRQAWRRRGAVLVLTLLCPVAFGCGAVGEVPESAVSSASDSNAQAEAAPDEDAQRLLAEAGSSAETSAVAATETGADSRGSATQAVDPAGQALFDDICAVCHGPDGTGRIGLDLTISTLTADEVREVLLNGRTETQMAGFAEILTSAEIDSLVAFVATLRRQG